MLHKDMVEIPAIFYKNFNHEISESVVFTHEVGNEIDMLLECGERNAVIVKGLRNISTTYQLVLGGWLKVLYVGENTLYIIKVMDHKMISKDITSVPYRVTLDLSPIGILRDPVDIAVEGLVNEVISELAESQGNFTSYVAAVCGIDDGNYEDYESNIDQYFPTLAEEEGGKAGQKSNALLGIISGESVRVQCEKKTNYYDANFLDSDFFVPKINLMEMTTMAWVTI
ncbi:hypothetical protein PIB30_086756 [Stylosanthes scabra]|uniref:Uncharacterized protein n=1 Tax=Stylosanthes scabra TaxID=79078 RepID=A0ABU6TSS4_9FABA|nr:hypothetical protein [Stylosanthes scabra]